MPRYIEDNSNNMNMMLNTSADNSDILRYIRRTLAQRLRNEHERLKNKNGFELENLYAMLELNDNILNRFSITNESFKKTFNETLKSGVGLKKKYKIKDRWYFSISDFTNKKGKKHKGIILTHQGRPLPYTKTPRSITKKRTPTPKKRSPTPKKRSPTPKKRTPTPKKKKSTLNPKAKSFVPKSKTSNKNKQTTNNNFFNNFKTKNKAIPNNAIGYAGGYVKIQGGGTRKVRHQKNGKAYILLNGRKVKL